MTNWGFISGCTILAFGIFAGAFYINRAIQAGVLWIAEALKDKKL
jgi:hypothetical protein